MASVNKVILLGRLGRDPETRYASEGGTAICHLALATSRRYKDRDGNRKEDTEWHNVVVFGRQAEIAQQYLRKGSEAYIEGRLRTASTRVRTVSNAIRRKSSVSLCSLAPVLPDLPVRRMLLTSLSPRSERRALPRRLLRRRSPSSRLLRMLIPRSMGMTFRSESERDAFRIKNGRL